MEKYTLKYTGQEVDTLLQKTQNMPNNMDSYATKEYVDNKIVLLHATIPTEGWTATAPYSIEIPLPGIWEEDTNCPTTPVYTIENLNSLQDAWNNISFIESKDGKIIVYCQSSLPIIEIPIQITVVR